jgi:hypothetical protein
MGWNKDNGCLNCHPIAYVLDLVSQIRDVVLVRCIFNSGNPWGSGFWNGEGMGRGWKWGDQFMSNLGPRWTDPITARRVPSK